MNNNPLLPNYPFHLDIVAGFTKIEKGNYLDFVIDRPNGMHGYIFHLTTEGKGIVFDGKQSFEATKGQLYLFSPKAIHHYSRHPQSETWHHQWIYFYPNVHWDSWLKWSNTTHHIGKIKIENTELFNELSGYFSQVEIELKNNNKFNQKIAQCLVEYLLIKCFSLDQKENGQYVDERISQICNIILEDLSKTHSINQLAELVFLSPSRLSHLFSQSLGIGISQWREQQKILEARHMLYFSNESITSIAKRLGYDDSLYFSKIFRKHLGVSPTTFRKGFTT
ncbi:arabinose operon transcriptional regulator AraC [Pasteurellaceae bacterium LIM206]|nr:arabinose operon transcriptional regulator AraC [Pasteurellaceae bacterium LIM206]